MSFLTMLGPSPDWNVGLSAEDLCTKECGWAQKLVQDLIPWDAGTDSGVSYEVSEIDCNCIYWWSLWLLFGHIMMIMRMILFYFLPLLFSFLVMHMLALSAFSTLNSFAVQQESLIYSLCDYLRCDGYLLETKSGRTRFEGAWTERKEQKQQRT